MRDGYIDPHCQYSRGEEIANSLTHGLGIAASCVGLIVLVVSASYSGDPNRIIGVTIFGASLILLYLASTLYHCLPSPRAKQVLRKLDHAAIYILIAGTYTPFMLVVVDGPLSWTILSIIWTLALVGVVFKCCWTGRLRRLSLAVYIGMGWLCVLAFSELLRNTPTSGFIFLVLGGLFYTGGTIFYGWKRLRFNHAIWHLFVLTGSVMHFLSVYQSVLR
ncbi:PAQR family membrane homeostasis protein TrhA [Desulfohalobium retbaense]|uniref:Channel protein, hemolysin III family n=1 Tax=Desulfohalobium retbaense (strain ATCC 49708 / DSM 5692 / JCM 16813 / HR100) TaxID=485915 RepID=C8X370_DESRD|nr:hemolysin III family protein [Desulfohalobium retbaense]ACV68867.1 channel protein, hemolysin III family [Desulfohalobium retbaense DSM 5692]